MKIINIDKTKNFFSYGLKCSYLFPEELISNPPLGAMRAIVKPNQASIIHNHHETEIFYIIKGKGIVESNSVQYSVSEGDLIHFSAFSDHTITNLSNNEPLEFLTFWWENHDEINYKLNELDIIIGKNILVTATPPTPNGDLHLGHIAGPYLGADIYSRFMRFQGNNTYFLSGSDVNQTYVLTKSKQKNITPLELVETNTNCIKSTLKKSLITYDAFYNPFEIGEYNQEIQKFFLELYNDGCLIIKKNLEYFDSDKNLHEAYISGTCPHCLSSSDGNCCEKCGFPHDATELIDPVSFYNGKLEKKEVEKLYFPLEKYREELLSYYSNLSLEPHHRYFINKLFSKKLPDIAISHPSSWGINHIIPTFENQIIYVWAEMLPGYLLATKKFSGMSCDEFNRRIQFYGFDNTFYHLVLFPAMLIAKNDKKSLPNQFIINEFLHLDGSKFSTSREHLIWAKDFFKDHQPDLVRMYLAKIRPEKSVTNFSIQNYNSFVDDFILNGLIKNIDRFWAIYANYGYQVPASGAWNNETKQLYKLILDEYHNIIIYHQAESFSPNSVMLSLNNLNDVLTKLNETATFLNDSILDKALMRTVLALQALLLKVMSISLVGIAPDFSTRIMRELNSTIKFEKKLMFISENTLLLPEKGNYFNVTKN